MRKLIICALLFSLISPAFSQVQQIKDIFPGDESSSPNELFQYKDFLLFAAESPNEGSELWISDGTAEGTFMLKDINVGQISSNPAEFVEFDNLVFFAATTAEEGRELWVTDGTTEGTQLLKDINPGIADSDPTDFLVFQDQVWLTATTQEDGAELWISDGTETGTSLFMDISEGAQSGSPLHKFEASFSGNMYFSAQLDTTGRELWVTDGTLPGTFLVQNIAPGSSSSDPMEFIEADGVVYFHATTDATGRELFRTDGTPETTQMIKDLYPGPTGSNPEDLTIIGLPFLTGQVLFYIGQEDTTGERLYAYLSSADTIFEYINLNQGRSMRPDNLGDIGNLGMYFTAYLTIPGPNGIDTIGQELFLVDVFGFLSDTAEAGEITVMTLINEDDAIFDDISLDLLDFYMYYSVQTDRFGKELYRTPIFGDFLLHERLSDVNPRAGDSEVAQISPIGKDIFFTAMDGSTGTELYSFKSELGEVELLQLPSRLQVFNGDTIDLGIVDAETDTLLFFEFGKSTVPSVRVEGAFTEGDGFFVTPIMPITFFRLGEEVRDTFQVNYVATEEGNTDVGTIYIETDYAEIDTLIFYIKAEVEMEVNEEHAFAKGWKVAPNPAIHEIQLSGPPMEDMGTLRILNTQGAILQEMDIDKFETNRSLYLQNLPSGQYFIHMVNKEGTQKVIPFIKG